MKIPTLTRCAAVLAAACALACQTTPGGSSGPGPVQIVYSVPTTITGTNLLDNPATKGTKRVGLQFQLTQTTTIKNVVLSYWRAGNNAGNQSLEVNLNRTVAASPSQPAGFTAFIEIPNSASYEPCEGLYYSMAATYQVDSAASPGLFLGGAHLILTTQKYVGNTIVQALCSTPPGPGE